MADFFYQKVILLLLILVCYSAEGFGQLSPQALFDQANEQLESGNYSQAISQYKKLEHQHYISGALFLNLGISYQRIDSLGKAKFYFLKASQFEETNTKAEKAFDFIETQFSRQSAVLPERPWDVAIKWLQHNLGAPKLLGIGIIILNIGVFIFIAHWFVRRLSYSLNIAGLVIIGFSLLIMITSFYTYYVSQRYSIAVMVTQKALVTEKPVQDSSLISQAFEGYTFTVDQYRSADHPGWNYVRMSNGLYGWIPEKEIMIL